MDAIPIFYFCSTDIVYCLLKAVCIRTAIDLTNVQLRLWFEGRRDETTRVERRAESGTRARDGTGAVGAETSST